MGIIGHNDDDDENNLGDSKPKSKLIIDINDIYDRRTRKKKELEFYTKELDKMMLRLSLIQHEIGVTETIITMIENEQIVDLRESIKEKRNKE